eukprot:gene5865-7296_t
MESKTNITKETVLGYLKALQKRDLEEVLKFFGDKVDWNIPGNREVAPWVGRRSSKDELRNTYFPHVWEGTEIRSLTWDQMIFQDNGTAILTGDFVSFLPKTGKLYSSPVTIQFNVSLDTGLITKYVLLEDSYELYKLLI